MERNNKSPHILNTSSNLFGLCFVVLTSLKALKLDKNTYVDELTVVSMFLFLASCMLSFLSIRSKTNRSEQYERIADNIFLGGLVSLFITTLFIMFNVIS